MAMAAFFDTSSASIQACLLAACKTLASVLRVPGPREPSSRRRSAGRPCVVRGAVRRDTSAAASGHSACSSDERLARKCCTLGCATTQARASPHLLHSRRLRDAAARIGAANTS